VFATFPKVGKHASKSGGKSNGKWKKSEWTNGLWNLYNIFE
jgi:hypothetical protein